MNRTRPARRAEPASRRETRFPGGEGESCREAAAFQDEEAEDTRLFAHWIIYQIPVAVRKRVLKTAECASRFFPTTILSLAGRIDGIALDPGVSARPGEGADRPRAGEISIDVAYIAHAGRSKRQRGSLAAAIEPLAGGGEVFPFLPDAGTCLPITSTWNVRQRQWRIRRGQGQQSGNEGYIEFHDLLPHDE
jgi:hypothetical protein